MSSKTPLVSFIVPCYKLAHYLQECVDSILAQSFSDFEILILDDCSPDHTPQVASSFTDHRVTYIRHDVNLGHLRNFNVGIERARGKYLWLVSADDRLRSHDVLARFVDALESDDAISLAFCPGLTLNAEGEEGFVMGRLRPEDQVISSDDFVKQAIQRNPVCTPGAMARRSCYLDGGLFPLDLPYSGDWFLWCVFGLAGKVAYFADAMVNYRLHDGSNTAIYKREQIALMVHDEVEVRWRVLALARHAGRLNLVRECHEAIARDYFHRLFKGRIQPMRGLTDADFEKSMALHADVPLDVAAIRSLAFELLGDEYHERGELSEARACYASARVAAPSRSAIAKHTLSRWGGPGLKIRNTIATIKRRSRGVAFVPEQPRQVVQRNSRPTVSVIVPCYNSAAFLAGALDSALSQTYGATEIVVVNDGSTDNFEEIVAPYRSSVTVIDQANLGVSAARNRALDYCSGHLIAYLDADDRWTPTKLERQVQMLTEQPELSLVHTGIDFIDERNGSVSSEGFRQEFAQGHCLVDLARENSVAISSVMHTRTVLGNDRFEPHLTAAEDWDMWLRLAARGPVGYLDAPLTRYRFHPNNASRQKRLMLTNSLAAIAKALKREQTDEVRRQLLRTRAALYRSVAHVEYESDNLAAARQLFWAGLPWLSRLDTARFITSSLGVSRSRLSQAFGRFRPS